MKRSAAQAVLGGASVNAVSHAMDVTHDTGRRWLAEAPEFRPFVTGSYLTREAVAAARAAHGARGYRAG